MNKAQKKETGFFVRKPNGLYWVAFDGSLMGPLNASTPTCGDNKDGEQPSY